MNGYLYLLLCGVIGAVIGALTNDIAIRCIFRFLIPRKKAQMAEAIKNVVSHELMSPEKVALKIRSERVRYAIQTNLRVLLDRFLDSELPSINTLLSDHPDTLDSMSEQVLGVMIEELTAKTEDRLFFKTSLQPLIAQEVEEMVARRPAEIVPALDAVVDTIPGRISKFLCSEGCRIRATAVALNILTPVLSSPRRLYEVVPEHIQRDIMALFKGQAPAITERIARFLESEENQAKIRSKINDAMEEYFEKATPDMLKSINRKLGGMFRINPGGIIRKALGIDKEIENICRSLPHKIRYGRDKDDILNHIEKIMAHFIDDLLQCRVKDIAENLDGEKLQSYLSVLYDQLITPEFAVQTGNDIQALARDAMNRSIQCTIDGLQMALDLEQITDTMVERLRTALRSKTFLDTARKRLSEAVNRLRDRKIGSLGRHLPDKSRQKLVFIAGDIVSETMTSRLEDFTKESGIWDIITESIQTYDNREIEGLVRKVANRELKWVTYLGGLIGFVIGILQGLFILRLGGFE